MQTLENVFWQLRKTFDFKSIKWKFCLMFSLYHTSFIHSVVCVQYLVFAKHYDLSLKRSFWNPFSTLLPSHIQKNSSAKLIKWFALCLLRVGWMSVCNKASLQ